MSTTIVTVSDDRFGRKDGKYSSTQDKIEKIFRNNPQFGITDFRMWKREDIINTEYYKNSSISSCVITEDIFNSISKNLVLAKGTEFPEYKILDLDDPSKNGRVYKPLAIYETLKSLNDGDFLIYTDCSPEMWNMPEDYIIDSNKFNLDIIKNLCLSNGGILTAHVKWNHRTHVKKGETGFHTHENFTMERCISRMGMKDYTYSLQHASGMIVLQKTKRSMDFLEEWLYWNSIEECGCMGPVTEPLLWYYEVMFNGKIGHRHDQSVSGLLINKMNNKIIETLDYYERPTNTSPYMFLYFCLIDHKYNFFDSNQPKGNLKHTMICEDGNPDYRELWTIQITER